MGRLRVEEVGRCLSTPCCLTLLKNVTLHLLPHILCALRGTAVSLRDVTHREGHETQCVVAMKQ